MLQCKQSGLWYAFPILYPAAGDNASTNRCEMKADLKKGWLNKLLTASNVLARIHGMKNVTSKCITVLGLAYLTVACGYGSPASGGLTGVTVNADGQLTMVASWCGNAPDGVVVYRRAAGELLEHADIKAPSMTGGIMSMNLEEMPAGWSLQEGSLNFEDGDVPDRRVFLGNPCEVRRCLLHYSVQTENPAGRGDDSGSLDHTRQRCLPDGGRVCGPGGTSMLNNSAARSCSRRNAPWHGR
ncbi:hypothetical protein E1286_34430 [Nonomuraea terrae]|uniref:Uncharacterized protein n=1 Tax=Nonomuraea terrae TaxID=2530383 RepID=A0A4R4Y9C6_9ACTN|nr:hypothetical protein [Nonomuraea terrae]TDD40319.1 hypothetical protein E1286_34430 [Nonomuraea terrae]